MTTLDDVADGSGVAASGMSYDKLDFTRPERELRPHYTSSSTLRSVKSNSPNSREDVGTKSTNKWNFSHRHSFVDRTAASGVSSGSAGAEGSEEHYQTLAQHPLYPAVTRKCANGAKTTNVNTNQQPSDASAAGLLFDDQNIDQRQYQPQYPDIGIPPYVNSDDALTTGQSSIIGSHSRPAAEDTPTTKPLRSRQHREPDSGISSAISSASRPWNSSATNPAALTGDEGDQGSGPHGVVTSSPLLMTVAKHSNDQVISSDEHNV